MAMKPHKVTDDGILKAISDGNPYLFQMISNYFTNQDFSVYIPGRQVSINGIPVELRMVLISAGKSNPYKVFYRLSNASLEVFLVRHPPSKIHRIDSLLT